MTTDRKIKLLAAACSIIAAATTLQAIPINARAEEIANNCFACHGRLIADQPEGVSESKIKDGRVLTGKMSVTDLGMKVDLGTQLDGETRGSLQTVNAAAGSTVSFQVDVLDGMDAHAVQIKGLETAGQLRDAANHITWSEAHDAGLWFRQELTVGDYTNPPYFSTDVLGGEDPKTHTFDLAIDASTPADLYNLTFAFAGQDGDGLFYQEEHLYLQVSGGAGPQGPADKLVNLSTRGKLTETEILTPGFVIEGEPKKVLIRVMGPTLGTFGVPTACLDPGLILFKQGVTDPIGENTKWSDAVNFAEIKSTAAAIGATPFADDSLDAAILITLEPGAYTVQARCGAGGEVLAEVYDASAVE